MRRAAVTAAVAAGFAITAGVAAWVWRADPEAAPVAAADPVPVVRAVKATPVARSSTSASSQAGSSQADRMRLQATAGPPEAPHFEAYVFLDRLDELTERAHAGDLDAMRELGDGLHGCLRHLRDPDAENLRETLAMQLDHGRAERGADLDRQAYARHDWAMREHADCLRIGAERAGTGLAWLERAARAGHLTARLAFVQRALDASSYPEQDDLYANLDEVIRRRELADRWIIEAIATGERHALAAIANSGEAVRDPRQRAVYELAWRHVLVRDFGVDSPHAEDLRRGMQRDNYLDAGQDWARDDAAWAGFLDEARAIAERTSMLPPEQRRPRPRPPGG